MAGSDSGSGDDARVDQMEDKLLGSRQLGKCRKRSSGQRRKRLVIKANVVEIVSVLSIGDEAGNTNGDEGSGRRITMGDSGGERKREREIEGARRQLATRKRRAQKETREG